MTVVGRGGLKLEAAIARFDLEPRLRGARAIDVGSSTGGFTEAMLRHGAAAVTAIDVGKGQLHPSLARDARVEVIDGVHFAKLPLGVASGPYDFFSVDVSFVAARTMLRGLAFRLRDGAEGVILVKPQFELPDKAVRGGDVSDPQLRARALEAVREKAEALGFRLVEAVDSPVAGGSGTVEILAHLRFEGRSDKLPKLGEKRRRDEKPGAGARGLGARLRYFAVAAPGLEAVVRDEVASLPGARAVEVDAGGVSFEGDLALARVANLKLRAATRVLLRLGEIESREFARLRRAAAKLPFAAVVPATARLTFHVAQTRSRLYHTGAVAETLAHAVADALGVRELPVVKPAEAEAALDTGDGAGDASPIAAIYARGVADRWTISVDTSGALLHRRGWRTEAGEAPLRETLAAGILALAAWDPSTPLVDPTCGSGTFVIEAALRALGRVPGRGRRFACDAWPSTPPPVADEPSTAATTPTTPMTPFLVGTDADATAIAIAQRNAERAGVAERVSFAVAPIASATPPAGAPPGLVVANPPYGRRLDDARGAAAAYRALGDALRRRFRGWRVAVLVPESRPGGPLERALGLHPVERHALTNGGLRVTLLVSTIRGGGVHT